MPRLCVRVCVFAADPSADVDGWDAQSKLVLLARLAYGVTRALDLVSYCGTAVGPPSG